jgi:RsiW-degrading membrane proteinase PrsW (M82 family)
MKLSLAIQSGALSGKTHELNGEFLTIGRGAGCDLMFDSLGERVVSTKHAYIENKPDGFYLVDNESTNGTFVNGKRINRIKLQNQDVIEFGLNGPKAAVVIDAVNSEAVSNSSQQIQPTVFQQPIVQQNHQQFQASQFPVDPQSQTPIHWRNSMANFGVANPTVKPAASQAGKYIGLAFIIFLMVFFGLIVSVMILQNLGIVAAVIAAVVAFVPATIYILPLMFLDRFDPEPPWALALAFAWGAIVALLFSAIVNDIVGYGFGEAVAAVVSAPVFEEASKGIGVVLIMLFLRREFDDILDGIVYAGVVALGFATVENVLYYGRGLLDGGFSALAVLFVLRGILSPFAHVTFTSMTGIGCGISRESHNWVVRIIMPVIGYGFAVFLHALWNGIATFGASLMREFGMVWLCDYIGLSGQGEGLCAFLLAYAVMQVPLFIIFVVFALFVMRRQNKILNEMLAIDVARGLISQEHL